MKLILFSVSLVFGLAYLASNFGNYSTTTASGPSEKRAPSSIPKHITNDSAIYQNLSEIKLPKEKKPDFDRDLDQLSGLEHRYTERGTRRVPQQAGRAAPANVSAPRSQLDQRHAQAKRIRAHAPRAQLRHPAPKTLSRR
jgi:hypothetical protein